MPSFLKILKKNHWGIKQLSLFYLFLLILVSCSHSKKETPNFLGIDLDIDSEVKRPLPDLKKGQGAKKYGPPVTTLFGARKKKSKRIPIVSLTLGPGVYRTMAFIPILKAIEENKIKIHFIGGHGLSAVIAAYYAFGFKPDLIEWKFHKLLTARGTLSPYSKEWRRELNRMIKKEFRKKRIEQANLNLFVPVYNSAKTRVEYLTRGNLSTSLMANLRLGGEKKKQYRAAFSREVFGSHRMKNFGADLSIGLDVLGEELKWKKGDGFIVGTFARAVGKSKLESSKLSLYKKIELEGLELDSPEILSEIFQVGRKSSQKISESIGKIIEEWSISSGTL